MEVSMTKNREHPVAVIGGGPVGLAAAAHLIDRKIPVRLYEAGETVGASVRDWGHVRTFSPWRYNIDAASRKLLEASQWREPKLDVMPNGAEIYDEYLRPLAATPEMAAIIETGVHVKAVTRHGMDKVTSRGRADRPFALALETADGSIRRDLARAVIDASGTWTNPNSLGGNGLPAEGESEHASKIAYGIPDVFGRERLLYAGRKILVVGAGHSAANALLDLVRLAGVAPDTEISWAVRGKLERVYGGGDADQLPARAELGAEVKRIVDSGRVRLIQNFSATAVRDGTGELRLEGDTPSGVTQIGPFDRIIVATGQRPDLNLTRELRLELDPWLESVRALGPLIDPNEHSCGDVPPHGHRELSHPEPGFYTVGIKSYGRAPTFLLLTGYEQVRSVVAAIAGDIPAADEVQLVLPETGVCNAPSEAGECCGGPAPSGVEACCVADAEAKAVGENGCGCGSTQATKVSAASCCGAPA
jgi:glycine/D-amino acid oxidase-like deaminating enzyme